MITDLSIYAYDWFHRLSSMQQQLPLYQRQTLSHTRWFSSLRFNSRTKHLLHCCLLFTLIIIFIFQLIYSTNQESKTFDPVEKYGILGCTILYLLRFLALLAMPQCLCNFLGLTIYNTFPKKVKLKGSPLLAPFICFRTVTRGDYPDLVKANVQANLETCLAVGVEHFEFQVVTDRPLKLDKHQRIKETVVPPEYKTKTGALYKARALQYCLEDDVNTLSDDDYIVHLDEETLLSENSVRGILNFTIKRKHEFGQGLITYANGSIINWFTTLADSFRVAEDMGKLRFQFYMFHRPLFSWKGSYVVSKFKAEKEVSYDHGLDGSVAEDCYFSMIAYKKGYTFDFIEGEMWEKSPFTISDFIQQRKRWLQGIFLVVHSPKIPFQNKLFLTMSLYAWMTIPLSTSNIVMAWLCPLPTDDFVLFNALVAFVGAVNVYMYIFGVIKSFSLMRLGYFKFIFCLIGALCAIPFNIIIENIAVIWGFFGNKHKFYVVQKQVETQQV